jgi:hypothetical protein
MTFANVGYLAEMQAIISACNPGLQRDRAQARLDALVLVFDAFPDRVATQAPFLADRGEVEAVVEDETESMVAALDALQVELLELLEPRH